MFPSVTLHYLRFLSTAIKQAVHTPTHIDHREDSYNALETH